MCTENFVQEVQRALHNLTLVFLAQIDLESINVDTQATTNVLSKTI